MQHLGLVKLRFPARGLGVFLISKATDGEDVGSTPAWGTIKFTQTIVLRKLMRQQQLSSPATKSQISSSYISSSVAAPVQL